MPAFVTLLIAARFLAGVAAFIIPGAAKGSGDEMPEKTE
jgi:hypothetical protein